MEDREFLELAANVDRLKPDEVICSQCRGEGRVGGMDPAIGGKSCRTCDGTGMQEEQGNERDHKLMMLAAKAEGRELTIDENGVISAWVGSIENGHWWDPLADDGDAMRLAVKLNLEIERSSLADRAYVGPVNEAPWVEYVNDEQDLYQATRRAIACAAAEIGKAMP